MKPGNLSVAGETKKTIMLTYAPASALCGVAKLLTANAIRWCVCVYAKRESMSEYGGAFGGWVSVQTAI